MIRPRNSFTAFWVSRCWYLFLSAWFRAARQRLPGRWATLGNSLVVFQIGLAMLVLAGGGFWQGRGQHCQSHQHLPCPAESGPGYSRPNFFTASSMDLSFSM